MQFATIILALAASVSAAVTPTYSNGTAPYVPSTNTTGASGTAAPSGTTAPTGTASFVPSEGAASRLSTGALGLLVVGGVAMAL